MTKELQSEESITLGVFSYSFNQIIEDEKRLKSHIRLKSYRESLCIILQRERQKDLMDYSLLVN